MSRNLKVHIQRLEQQLRSKQHRGITLEELERAILERNPEAFHKPAMEPGMSFGMMENIREGPIQPLAPTSLRGKKPRKP